MDEKGSTRNGDKRPDLKPYRTSLDLMFALIVVILCSEFLAMVFLFFIRTFPPAVPMGLVSSLFFRLQASPCVHEGFKRDRA